MMRGLEWLSIICVYLARLWTVFTIAWWFWTINYTDWTAFSELSHAGYVMLAIGLMAAILGTARIPVVGKESAP